MTTATGGKGKEITFASQSELFLMSAMLLFVVVAVVVAVVVDGIVVDVGVVVSGVVNFLPSVMHISRKRKKKGQPLIERMESSRSLHRYRF